MHAENYNTLAALFHERTTTIASQMGFPTTMFLEQPPSDLICSICHDVMKHPHAGRCGHSFCKDCLRSCSTNVDNEKSYFEQGSTPYCPLCQKKLKYFRSIPNLALESLIGKLPVSCPYHVLVTVSSSQEESNDFTKEATSPHNCDAVTCNDHYSASVCNWEGSLTDWVQQHTVSKLRERIPYHLTGGREKAEQYVKNTNEYMKLLEHASNCKYVLTTCPTSPKNCPKMKKALEHFTFCQTVVKNHKKKRLACKLCQQLSISIQMHARICKKHPSVCTVPNCSVFKKYYEGAPKAPKPERQISMMTNSYCL